MPRTRLMAVGDTCLVTKRSLPPFDGVKGLFSDSDVLFGNLETALTEKGREAERAVPLHVPPCRVDHLVQAGFSIVNVANNHVMDMGPDGFSQTLETLGRSGILQVGATEKIAGEPFTLLVAGETKFGFLAYSQFSHRPGDFEFIRKLDRDAILRDLAAMRCECDIPVVSLHWGIENTYYPSPAQVALARELVANGAVLVLGHHPSVLQGVERRGNSLVSYSLGNFQFIDDAPASLLRSTRETFILQVDFEGGGAAGHNILPVWIDDDYRPVPVGEGGAGKLTRFIEGISLPILEDRITPGWWHEEIGWRHLATNLSAWGVRIRRYGPRHALMCLRWMVERFTLRCFFGVLRRPFRSRGPAPSGPGWTAEERAGRAPVGPCSVEEETAGGCPGGDRGEKGG